MDKEPRCCYSCQHQSLCHLRRTIRNAVQDDCWMLGGDGTIGQWMDAFDAVGKACNQYERIETETEET